MRLLAAVCTGLAVVTLAAGCTVDGFDSDKAQETGPWSIKTGMTETEVRKRLGTPARVLRDLNCPEPGRVGPCLIYPATKPGTAIDYLYFCLNRASRVSKITYGIHG